MIQYLNDRRSLTSPTCGHNQAIRPCGTVAFVQFCPTPTLPSSGPGMSHEPSGFRLRSPVMIPKLNRIGGSAFAMPSESGSVRGMICKGPSNSRPAPAAGPKSAHAPRGRVAAVPGQQPRVSARLVAPAYPALDLVDRRVVWYRAGIGWLRKLHTHPVATYRERPQDVGVLSRDPAQPFGGLGRTASKRVANLRAEVQRRDLLAQEVGLPSLDSHASGRLVEEVRVRPRDARITALEPQLYPTVGSRLEDDERRDLVAGLSQAGKPERARRTGSRHDPPIHQPCRGRGLRAFEEWEREARRPVPVEVVDGVEMTDP